MLQMKFGFLLILHLTLAGLSIGQAFASDCATTVETKYVRGVSMTPLLKPDEPIQAEVGYFACNEPAHGDIALVQIASRKDPIVKQIAVVPGDKIEMRKSDSALLVNDSPLKNTNGQVYRFTGNRLKLLSLYVENFHGLVPKDTYFVFGTDVNGSYDSGRFGPVTRQSLIAKVRLPKP